MRKLPDPQDTVFRNAAAPSHLTGRESRRRGSQLLASHLSDCGVLLLGLPLSSVAPAVLPGQPRCSLLQCRAYRVPLLLKTLQWVLFSIKVQVP